MLDRLQRAIHYSTIRTDYLGKLNLKCPKCGSTQLQLTNYPNQTVIYKCRHCKYKFNFTIPEDVWISNP